MTYQITGNSAVRSTAYSFWQRKHQSPAFWPTTRGESTGHRGFPSQKASNAEDLCLFSQQDINLGRFSLPWRHYELWGQTQTLFLKHTDHLPVWFSIHYALRRLTTKSHEVPKPRYWIFWRLYRLETWQAFRQRCCRDVCQISELLEKTKPKSRGFETSQRSPVRSVSI